MATQVYTESVCDRCGVVHRREGAGGNVPPVGWAVLQLGYRAEGAGWSGGGRAVKTTLCPDCARVVERAALPERP